MLTEIGARYTCDGCGAQATLWTDEDEGHDMFMVAPEGWAYGDLTIALACPDCLPAMREAEKASEAWRLRFTSTCNVARARVEAERAAWLEANPEPPRWPDIDTPGGAE